MTKFSEWRIWNGGECPVAPDTLVQVQFADETRSEVRKRCLCNAKKIRWEWRVDGDGSDIIAYREVLVPVVTTKVLHWQNMGAATEYKSMGDTHTITLTLIDGEPKSVATVERIVR